MPVMARGWESKSVESQQEEREAAKGQPPAPSAEEQERLRQIGGLQLSRQRILSELACARGNRQSTLRAALEEIDRKIAELGGG